MGALQAIKDSILGKTKKTKKKIVNRAKATTPQNSPMSVIGAGNAIKKRKQMMKEVMDQ